MKPILLCAALCLTLLPSPLCANAKNYFRQAEAAYEEAYANARMRQITGVGPSVSQLAIAARHLKNTVKTSGGDGWTKAWILKARVEGNILENATDEDFVDMQISRDAMIRRFEDSILTAVGLIQRHGAGSLDHDDLNRLFGQFANVVSQSGYQFAAGESARGADLLRAALEIKELRIATDGNWPSYQDEPLRNLLVPLMGQVYYTDDDLFEIALTAWLQAEPEADEVLDLHRGLEKEFGEVASARMLDLGRIHHPRNFAWLKLEVFVAVQDGARLEHAPLIQSALDADADNWLSPSDPFLIHALVAAYDNGYKEAQEKKDAAELRRLFPLIAENLRTLRYASKENMQLLASTCQLFLEHMSFLDIEARRLAGQATPEATAQADSVLKEMAETASVGLPHFEEIEPLEFANPDVLTFLMYGYQATGDEAKATAFAERLQIVQSGGTLSGPFIPPAAPSDS